MTLTQNKTSIYIFLTVLIIAMFTSTDVLASGLDTATSEATKIKEWGYKFLGVAALGYIIFNVVMAYLGRKGWGEVAMAVIYAAIAGAAIVLGEWAWGLWGS